MKAPYPLLKDILEKAFQRAYGELEGVDVVLTQSTQEKFGHYQCNGAMPLAKVLGKSPREIAQEVVERVDDPAIAKLEVAGPGFINITLSNEYLTAAVEELLFDPHLGIPLPEEKQKIIVEFSSPNTAKELHVGHLRSTIIGDCIARVFEFLGHNVLRLNHVGDWGTQFGMLIAFMKREQAAVISGKESATLTDLMGWYKASKALFDADEAFKKESQLEVVALQGGDPGSLAAWEMICEISRKAYQEIYDLLDVKLVERGESFYNLHLPEVIADLEEKGLITVSDGAKCIFLEGFTNREGKPLPLMVQKSDGGYNYDTTDMAAIKHRTEEEKANRIIYITDAGQSLHFQMLFKAAEKAGYLNSNKVRADHVTFGLVLGTDGKKFRTRSGETEKLIDLLNTAVDRAAQILEEKSPEKDAEEKLGIAQVLGINAIKYADLSCNRSSDYVFSYDKMLQFEGNTAAFLMYAYVRIAGIKRKVGVELAAEKGMLQVTHPSEISLALHLLQFGETLEQLTQDLLPNRLTDYLYNLAQKFHAFFRDCRVEGTQEQNSRLLLCEAAANTLKQGLTLLGMRTVDRM